MQIESDDDPELDDGDGKMKKIDPDFDKYM